MLLGKRIYNEEVDETIRKEEDKQYKRMYYR
jgi:hypothetical protein